LARAIQSEASPNTPRTALSPETQEREKMRGILLAAGRKQALPEELPAMLANPTANRARECLVFLAEHPGASNREIAAGIGVTHRSQISKLLSYFLQEKLVSKRSEGPGKPNIWRIAPHGEEILRRMQTTSMADFNGNDDRRSGISFSDSNINFQQAKLSGRNSMCREPDLSINS
jgi:DNA-binding MarR family transcriptional regulator